MTGRLQTLLEEIDTPSGEGVFNVKRLADSSVFYAGRDSRGCASILIATSESGRTVPLRLAGIEAMFSTPCQIVESGLQPITQTVTAIICTNQDREVSAYFAYIMEALLPLLGDSPTTEKVAEAVRQLVDLFQKLRSPARRSLLGLVGELNVIEAASDVAVAVRSWRSDDEERFDFGVRRLRLDVKASSNRQRVHEISFEQANPPDGTTGIIASIWIEAMAGGVSLSELLNSIERRLSDRPREIARLRTIVANTLGEALPQAMDWRFDKKLAESSFRYFDAKNIPAIRPPLPSGVSSARFVSDLSGCMPIELHRLNRSLDATEQGLLPK
jgi:hypothetical protein